MRCFNGWIFFRYLVMFDKAHQLLYPFKSLVWCLVCLTWESIGWPKCAGAESIKVHGLQALQPLHMHVVSGTKFNKGLIWHPNVSTEDTISDIIFTGGRTQVLPGYEKNHSKRQFLWEILIEVNLALGTNIWFPTGAAPCSRLATSQVYNEQFRRCNWSQKTSQPDCKNS